jgi:hypothetical protein
MAASSMARFRPSPAPSGRAGSIRAIPRKFNDVDVLEVVVDLPDPGPLVVGQQVDVYFKSDQAETQ